MSFSDLSSGLNAITESIGDALSNPFGNAFGIGGDAGSAVNPLQKTNYTNGQYNTLSGNKMWRIAGKDWYKVFPHRFEVEQLKTNGDLNLPYYFALPIPPQAIRITPVYASQVTPTIGGVVEEVSPVTLWKINMSGTMGTGIGYEKDSGTYDANNNRIKVANNFRNKVSTTGLLAGIGSQLQTSINAVSSVADTAIGAGQALLDGNIAGAVSGAVDSINNIILPKLPYSSSAVPRNSNGFTEIHELQKFFHMYSQLKSADPNKYNLYFTQFKTNQRWRIVVNGFTISQSLTSPNMYKYDIALTGWNCSPSGSNKELEYDRFAPGTGDLAPVNTVGLEQMVKLGKEVGGNMADIFKNTGIGWALGN